MKVCSKIPNHLEIFYTLKEAQVLIEEWRLEYNTFRPHSSLKYRTPAPEAWLHSDWQFRCAPLPAGYAGRYSLSMRNFQFLHQSTTKQL
jgi:hypothetical protein